MNISISQINKNETLRYLGYSGQDISESLQIQLNETLAAVLEAARPRGTVRYCDGEIYFAATLGAEVDRLIMKYQAVDMGRAVIADAAASALIEQACDALQEEAGKNLCNMEITGRVSPGYGDWPLADQRRLILLMDAERQIGLTLTEGGMLCPIKSVTGKFITGGGNKNCESCESRDTCKFRRKEND